jgi:hypothetical protein
VTSRGHLLDATASPDGSLVLFTGSATRIAQALEVNRTLRFLDCAFNPFSDIGCQNMGRSLEENEVSQKHAKPSHRTISIEGRPS